MTLWPLFLCGFITILFYPYANMSLSLLYFCRDCCWIIGIMGLHFYLDYYESSYLMLGLVPLSFLFIVVIHYIILGSDYCHYYFALFVVVIITTFFYVVLSHKHYFIWGYCHNPFLSYVWVTIIINRFIIHGNEPVLTYFDQGYHKPFFPHCKLTDLIYIFITIFKKKFKLYSHLGVNNCASGQEHVLVWDNLKFSQGYSGWSFAWS